MERLYSAQEVADLFQVQRERIYVWCRQYDWPHVRVGAAYRFTEEQLEQIVETHSTGDFTLGLNRLPGQTYLSAVRNGPPTRRQRSF